MRRAFVATTVLSVSIAPVGAFLGGRERRHVEAHRVRSVAEDLGTDEEAAGVVRLHHGQAEDARVGPRRHHDRRGRRGRRAAGGGGRADGREAVDVGVAEHRPGRVTPRAPAELGLGVRPVGHLVEDAQLTGDALRVRPAERTVEAFEAGNRQPALRAPRVRIRLDAEHRDEEVAGFAVRHRERDRVGAVPPGLARLDALERGRCATGERRRAEEGGEAGGSSGRRGAFRAGRDEQGARRHPHGASSRSAAQRPAAFDREIPAARRPRVYE